MTIAIIGGAGFVGTRLAKIFDRSDCKYEIFDKVLDGDNYIDITIPETLDVLHRVKDLKLIINLAAEHTDNVYPVSLYDKVNVEGSKNICTFCSSNNIQNIIFTSSVAVYGESSLCLNEQGPINFFNDYGRTKFEAENVYRKWFQEKESERNLTIIRPAVILGEGNRGNVYNLINQIYKRRFLMIGDGKNIKSMAYVENVAKFISYSRNFSGYSLYNYIDKPDYNMNSLVKFIRKILFNRETTGIRIPYFFGLLIGYIFDLVSLISNKKLSISSIRVKKFVSSSCFESTVNETKFKAPISLEEGIKKTIKYEFLD